MSENRTTSQGLQGEGFRLHTRQFSSSDGEGSAYGFAGGAPLVSKDVRQRLSARINTTLFGINNGLTAVDPDDFIIDSFSNSTININPAEVPGIPVVEGLQELAGHRREVDELNLRAELPEWEAAYSAWVALDLYLNERSRIKAGEEKTPLSQYYRVLSGDVAELIPQEVLRESRTIFLDKLGLSAATDPRVVREVYQQHHALTRVTGKTAIERYFRADDEDLARQQVEKMGDPEMANFSYRFHWRRDEKGSWTCWERGVGDEFQLDMNEARLGAWNLGEVQNFAAHESRGHFAMLHRQNLEIAAGNVDDIAALLLMPDPRCWPFEAVGQTQDVFTGFRLSHHGEIAASLYRMTRQALTNAIFALEITGASMDDVIQETLPYTPQKTEEQLRVSLQDNIDNPFWRAYLPIYGRANHEFMVLASNLVPAKRIEVIKELFRRAMTRQQFIDFTRGSIFRP